MKYYKKTLALFRLWLLLYRIENFIWERYSDSFMTISKKNSLPQCYRDQLYYDDIPF